MVFGSRSIRFNPDKDIPPLTGKVILVTGGNAGLGKQCVLEFARHSPAKIWLAARSLQKAQEAADDVKQQVPGAPIQPLVLDLTSFESIRNAAETVMSQSDRLDILMLNAGIMATAPGLTKDGYEIQFGTNHMGHALLTKLLIPLLERTANTSKDADVRVVSMASHGHLYADKEGIHFDSLKTLAEDLGAFGRYHQSKLSNVLWARQLAKAYPQFTVASIHPGVVQTQLMNRASGSPRYIRALTTLGYRFLATVQDGVKNQLWASVSKDVKSGEYYEPIGVGGLASDLGKDEKLAKRIWDWTENELKAIQ